MPRCFAFLLAVIVACGPSTAGTESQEPTPETEPAEQLAVDDLDGKAVGRAAVLAYASADVTGRGESDEPAAGDPPESPDPPEPPEAANPLTPVRAVGRYALPRPGPAQVTFLFEAGRQEEGNGELGKAVWAYREAVAAYEENPTRAEPAKQAAAMAQFSLAELNYQKRFLPIQLGKATTKRIGRRLERFLRIATETAEMYRKAATMADTEWSIAAMIRVGDVTYVMAGKIVAIPLPLELERTMNEHPDQAKEIVDAYRSALEQRAAPLFEKAKQHWREALARASAAGIDNQWTAAAKQSLAR